MTNQKSKTFPFRELHEAVDKDEVNAKRLAEGLRKASEQVRIWLSLDCKGEVPRVHLAVLHTFADSIATDWFEQEAYRRYNAGEQHSISTGICGSVTAGYEIDDYGYFKYPLQIHQTTYEIIPLEGN